MKVFFDDESLTDEFNVYLVSRPDIPVSEMKYETVTVPGRNGELTRELGYQNVTLELNFNFYQKNNGKRELRKIISWLTDKKKLTFSDDLDVYRVITQKHIAPINDFKGRLYAFKLTLTLDPFWYENNGERTITAPTMINNPTSIAVDGKMRIYGTGTCEVKINGEKITIYDVKEFVDIEKRNAHKRKVSKNGDMMGDYPVFIPGNNTVEIGGGTERVVVSERWAWL